LLGVSPALKDKGEKSLQSQEGERCPMLDLEWIISERIIGAEFMSVEENQQN
jgi:hypothetical protein